RIGCFGVPAGFGPTRSVADTANAAMRRSRSPIDASRVLDSRLFFFAIRRRPLLRPARRRADRHAPSRAGAIFAYVRSSASGRTLVEAVTGMKFVSPFHRG